MKANIQQKSFFKQKNALNNKIVLHLRSITFSLSAA